MNADDVMNCPFCGSKPEFKLVDKEDWRGRYCIKPTLDCCVTMEGETIDGHTIFSPPEKELVATLKARLIVEWNSREPDLMQDEE